MPTVSNKHSGARRIFYPRFDGGLNLSASPETISKSEQRESLNMEVSSITGKLKVRGGLVWVSSFPVTAGDEIVEIIPIQGSENFLGLSRNKKLYHYKNGRAYDTGITLGASGSGVSAAMWDEKILLAYGYKLLEVSDEAGRYVGTVIFDGPESCRYVFVRNGRVGVVDGDDTIRYSGVGDSHSWSDEPDDDSTSKSVEIGYKDGMNIAAVVPLSRDLIVFKGSSVSPDTGIIWRLTGDYPDWQVLEAAHNTGTYNHNTIQIVGNDVFYITESGLATLSTVMEYGDIKMSWSDRKVSEALTELITSSARLLNIPAKSQLWVIPSYNDEKVWVLDYSRGIWTNFEFPQLPTYALCVKGHVLVIIGSEIYELDDCYYDDNMRSGSHAIRANVKLGALTAGHQVLVKGAYASYEINSKCNAELCLKGFRMPLLYMGEGKCIYDNTTIAYEADEPLFPDEDNVMTSRRRCIVRGWVLMPEIRITGGGFELSTLGFETVEV